MNNELEYERALTRQLKKDNNLMQKKIETIRSTMKSLLNSVNLLLGSPIFTDPRLAINAADWLVDMAATAKALGSELFNLKMATHRADVLSAQRDFLLAEIVRFKNPNISKKEFDELVLGLQTNYNKALESELKAYEVKL